MAVITPIIVIFASGGAPFSPRVIAIVIDGAIGKASNWSVPEYLALAGLAIGFALPALAQEQNTVDPEVRQQIEAVIVKFDEAFNRRDAAAAESDVGGFGIGSDIAVQAYAALGCQPTRNNP